MSVTVTPLTSEWGEDRMLNPALLSHGILMVGDSANYNYMEPADTDAGPYARFLKIARGDFTQVSETALSGLTSSSSAGREQDLLHDLRMPALFYTVEGTHIDRLFGESLHKPTQCHDAIEQYRMEVASVSILAKQFYFEKVVKFLNHQGFNKCAERLIYLYTTDDLEEGDEPLTLESAQGFVHLIRDLENLGEPLLGLFSEGTLSVEWRIADDKHLLIEPLDSENASFALIGPSTKRGEKFRLNGRGKIADIINTLQKNGVTQWGNM